MWNDENDETVMTGRRSALATWSETRRDSVNVAVTQPQRRSFRALMKKIVHAIAPFVLLLSAQPVKAATVEQITMPEKLIHFDLRPAQEPAPRR